MPAINRNFPAAGAAGSLNGHYGRLVSSARRLSTGLRVNSAADDAAGLAIRELMRSNVASLNQGIRNVNDAISMIQVADGALAIIDEKLIRMKELAEQAATGTYDSTQRLMIASEFQAMGDEINRIARATDFNGIKLLDGSLSGEHNGAGINSTGRMKIHFGTANDSAEDYYYIDIGDCTLAGLGLAGVMGGGGAGGGGGGADPRDVPFEVMGITRPPMNDVIGYPSMPFASTLQNVTTSYPDAQGNWRIAGANQNVMFIIPAGTKNFVLNATGTRSGDGDNDIQLFTMAGKHLAGTPITDRYDDAGNLIPGDIVFQQTGSDATDLDSNCQINGGLLPFSPADYDDSLLNMGPQRWDGGNTVRVSTYNGMNIGYSGDGERQDPHPNDGKIEFPSGYYDYEVLAIDNVTEDLIVWFPGIAGTPFKYYMDYQGPAQPPHPDPRPDDPFPGEALPGAVEIKTQAEAQEALVKIDEAIVKKDNIRAHLGALQNRLENTAANLTIQAENLQAAESRISDADIATEMTIFVRNQILTQAATAMLGQANTLPQMAASLLQG